MNEMNFPLPLIFNKYICMVIIIIYLREKEGCSLLDANKHTTHYSLLLTTSYLKKILVMHIFRIA